MGQFLGECRHLAPRTSVKNPDIPGTQPKRHTSAIDGRVSSPNDHNIVTRLQPIAECRFPEECGPINKPMVYILFAGDTESSRFLNTCGDKNGVELMGKIIKTGIITDRCVYQNFHAQGLDSGNFDPENVPWQSIGWNPHRHHAAGNGQGFEYGDPVPLPGKIGRTGQSGRTGADNGDPALFLSRDHQPRERSMTQLIVCDESFQRGDRHRLVNLTAATRVLTRMGAHSAADAWKWIGLTHHLQGFKKTAGGNE